MSGYHDAYLANVFASSPTLSLYHPPLSPSASAPRSMTIKQNIVNALKRILPLRVRYWLGEKRVQLGRHTALTDRLVNFNELKRLTPYRPAYGWHRGQCIDRYYIESFIDPRAQAIQGCVLEIAEPAYTRQFGGKRVTRSEVLDLDPGNRKATITANLTDVSAVENGTFDTIICTQTLHCIHDFHAAFKELHRMLKPGGVLIATFPGIAQLCPQSMMGAGHDYWRFTHHSVRLLAQTCFEPRDIEIRTYGNVYSAIAFLHGLVSTELSRDELDHHDEDYQVIIGLHARKSLA